MTPEPTDAQIKKLLSDLGAPALDGNAWMIEQLYAPLVAEVKRLRLRDRQYREACRMIRELAGALHDEGLGPDDDLGPFSRAEWDRRVEPYIKDAP